MTTVVYQNGFIYSDTKLSVVSKTGKILESYTGQKIFTNDYKKKVVTWSGAGFSSVVFSYSDLINKFGKSNLWWFTSSSNLASHKEDKVTSTIMVTDKYVMLTKHICLFSLFKRQIMYVILRKKYPRNTTICIGSGADYALEAIREGLTPTEACVFASVYDNFSNNEITQYAC